MKNFFAALVAFFSHPAVAIPAAVKDFQDVEQGITIATTVVTGLKDGNTKTAALDALQKAATLSAYAVNEAHTAEAVAAVIGGISAPSATPTPQSIPDAVDGGTATLTPA